MQWAEKTIAQAWNRNKNSDMLNDIEQKYQALFEQSPYGILLIDTEGKILDFNERSYLDLGYTREEFANITIADIDPDESALDVKARISQILEKGSAEFETRHLTKQGKIRNVHNITKVVVLSGQTLLHAIWRDITERKQAEEYLLATQQELLEAQRIAHLGNWDLDLQTGKCKWSDESYRIFGFEPGTFEPTFIKFLESVHPEDRKAVEAYFPDLLSGKLSRVEFDLRIIRPSGEERIINVKLEVLTDKNGKPFKLSGISLDITERMRAEERLRETNTRLETLIQAMPDLVILKDAMGRYIVVNKAVEECTGGKQEELIGKTNNELLPPNVAEMCNRSDDEAIRKGSLIHVDEQCFDREGKVQFLDTIKAPIYDSKGSLNGLLCVARNITERKEAEEKIRQSEEFIRNILDTVDEGFIVIDRDYRILISNKAYCSQVGESCDLVIGRHCYEISHKTLRPCYEEGEECAVRHVFETGDPHTALHKHPDAKGSILYVETKAFPIKDSTGAVISVIETVNNITERHLLEEEQLKTQKLEAIGTLAGGIAHDFNNLLQGVFGYISMAKITLDQKERSLTMLEQAEKALHMSVNLTTQLLTFSKGGKPVKKKVQLKSVIENSVRFALSGSSVDFRITFDENLWVVDADEGQIGQVIQNIVLNADQAMPEGGTIKISAKNVYAPHKGLPALLAEGIYIEISVKDNGIGIPEKYIPRLFDPYFTTKEKGSGLGLATSYSIIKNHGGLIDVKSQLGKGSTFLVYLPALEAEEKRVVTIPATAHAARKGRILVMDDEELLRNIVGIMLRALGHDAEFAENGEEAIVKYREALSAGKRFDIVILDLTIRGGMGGEETFRELLTLDPEVKAVVSSGYADSATISEYESRGFSACLAKPYAVDALRNILNMLLK
jgi:PAS domain S-box-containing protein